jgi:hypothetical protein
MDSATSPNIPLSAEVLSRTPQEAIDLIVRLQEMSKAQQPRIEALEARIVTLEARLNRNSGNSNKPPSTDSPFKQRPSGATKLKTPRKHKGKRYELLDPTDVHHLHPGACSCGNTEFEETEPFYIHQVIELPKVELSVDHFVLYRAKCPVCGKTVKTTVPHEHRTGFGPRLSASIIELVGAHGDSRRAAQEYLFSASMPSVFIPSASMPSISMPSIFMPPAYSVSLNRKSL